MPQQAQSGIDRRRRDLAVPKDQAGKIDLYIRAVDRELEAWFTPETAPGPQDSGEDPSVGLEAAGDHGAGA